MVSISEVLPDGSVARLPQSDQVFLCRAEEIPISYFVATPPNSSPPCGSSSKINLRAKSGRKLPGGGGGKGERGHAEAGQQ